MFSIRAFKCPECNAKISLEWLMIGDSQKIYECGICNKKFKYNDNVAKYYIYLFIITFVIASALLAIYRKTYLHMKTLPILQTIELFIIYFVVYITIFSIFRSMSLIIVPNQYKIIENYIKDNLNSDTPSNIQVRKKRSRRKMKIGLS